MSPGGAFVPNNIPVYLRDAEAAAIEWGRDRGVGLFNDTREKLGMHRYRSFDDFEAPDETREALKSFYNSVDDVELYVGCMVEQWLNLFDTSPTGYQGWGIPPTLLNSIMNDAVSSLIYDRFHTTDFLEENLTEWGYARALHNSSLMRLVSDHAGIGDLSSLYAFNTVPVDEAAKLLPTVLASMASSYDYEGIVGAALAQQSRPVIPPPAPQTMVDTSRSEVRPLLPKS